MPRDASNPSVLDDMLRQISEEAGNENTSGLTPDTLAALGEELWDWTQGLTKTEQTCHLRESKHAKGRMLLEAAGPDRPFLVDSLLAECAARGHEVLTLFHPILVLDNGNLFSAIQIHLPMLTAPEQAELLLEAEKTLLDVTTAVTDYLPLRRKMLEAAARLKTLEHSDPELRDEAAAFLDWLADNHFVFLGARDYEFPTRADGTFIPDEPVMIAGSNLGVLRDEVLDVLHRDNEPTMLTASTGAFLHEPQPLIIAKSNLFSRVHRRVFCDYVGVKQYDGDGKVCGETRFVGLFTADAYDEMARSIPLLRHRVEKVIEASGATPGGHSEKALANILETWPRDELYQTDAATLTPMALGALHLIGRPRTRLFIRMDRFDRFVSALVYVPRDAYDTSLRERITDLLEDAYDGRLVSFQPRFDAGPMARVHFVVALNAGHPTPDANDMEARIAELARTWDDGFHEELAASDMAGAARAGAVNFHGAFNAAYREAYHPREALEDVAEMSALDADNVVRLRAYRLEDDGEEIIRAKIYARGHSIPLSRCVPIFEQMGLFVEFETGYPVRPTSKPTPDAPKTYWVHALSMRSRDGSAIDIEAIRVCFQDTFVAVWTGAAENDGFNRLVFTSAAASWREAALLRTLSAYRKQTGLDPERPTQIRAFTGNPDIARLILDLFAAKFDSSTRQKLPARARKADAIRAEIDTALLKVALLGEDRVLRRTADLIMATQRTNYFSTGSETSFIAIKIASRELADLPEPKPYREIFMASPRVAGVHCRFGPVARGGLRWSDRRDDYRTEVLGLVKAQQVKNAVIVPVGSKGGFFPKKMPVGGTRDEVREAGIAAYREFITALLSLTDNLEDGKLRHPDDMIIWDGDDPYLVVAADKGTATFSDIANEISVAHDFWLGDAFASGGSAGYDHKKMGITARGAWEAVKRHFREIDRDIQKEPFTVIGCGDMSGDVFGNGMLLSKEIRLLAAFNHMHIFVDPNPNDPGRTWKERQRMFDLPRSSWADYDAKLISKGGGIFERSAKSIKLTPEIKTLTGLGSDAVTPDELIHALLKADCDLMWFGGIGTYIKATDESHDDAGDRANDGVRVNADEVRAKVIGEGANLGLTQAARIGFARRGGRINTDAIDNSAGVDSSDHEVNIKILLAEAIRRGDLKPEERNTLLASMTDDVAAHVLAHNYNQANALTLAEATAATDHETHERLMCWLESKGVLNREVEGLPTSEDMRERATENIALTRPELSVLLAWSKIVLFDEIMDSDVPDDPHFAATLKAYFPDGVAGLDDARDAHRLKREIIATVLANRLLDMGGPCFLLRLRETTGKSGAEITRAFEIARITLGAQALGDAVNALDTQIPTSAQTAMHLDIAMALSRATALFSDHDGTPIDDVLANYVGRFAALKQALPSVLKPYVTARIARRAKGYVRASAPEDIASDISVLMALALGHDILSFADKMDRSPKDAAATFFAVGDALRLDRLRAMGEDSLSKADYWERLATRRLMDDLIAQQSAAARLALENAPAKTSGAKAATAWLDKNKVAADRLHQAMTAMDVGRVWSFAKFSLVTDAVRQFMSEVQ